MARIAIFLYGILSYTVFLGAFLYAIGFVGGFGTPTSLDGEPHSSHGVALAIDLCLLVVFAVQHSGMARAGFKSWLTRYVPSAAERSTYVLASSLVMIALYVLWQPIGGIVWSTSGAARVALIAINLAGWALLLYATFLIDHFDLFGLAQVWRRLRNQAAATPRFHTPGLYRLVRHPIYTAWLVIFWAAPTMTIAHLIFALGTTGYILLGIQLEERDLTKTFGDEYAEYRERTPMLIPGMRATEPKLPASDADFV